MCTLYYIALIALFGLGVWLWSVNQDPGELATITEQRMKRRNRYLGVAMMVIGLGGCLLLWYRSTKQSAEMPMASACGSCHITSQRRKNLQPWKQEELPILEKLVENCNKCSLECTKDVQRLRDIGSNDVANTLRKDCISLTEEALSATAARDRLRGRVRGKQSALRAGFLRMGKDVLPAVPK